jgi:hypothetical protein
MKPTKEEHELLSKLSRMIVSNPDILTEVVKVAAISAMGVMNTREDEARKQAGRMEIIASVGAQIITGNMKDTKKNRKYFTDLVKSKLKHYLPNKTYTNWEWFK